MSNSSRFQAIYSDVITSVIEIGGKILGYTEKFVYSLRGCLHEISFRAK